MTVDVLHLSTETTLRGGERQLLLLHERLPSSGITSHLLCRAGGRLAARATAGTSSFGWLGLADPAGLLRAWRRAAALHPALLHCHDSRAFTLGSLIGGLSGIPVITTRRVAFPIRAGALNRWKYRRAARVVAVSNGVASRLGGLVDPERVTVVHDGVSCGTPALSRERGRLELGFGADAVVAGTVGYFSREKNLRQFFELAATLHRTDPAVRFACIGPMDPAAARAAASIPGLVAPGEVPDARVYYPAFDLYVSPSTSEGLGSALLDAVVRDIPAVALDALGNRDVYPPGSPWLVPDAERLAAEVRALLRDLPAARATARRNGARAREIFDVDRMVDGNAAVYRGLLGRS